METILVIEDNEHIRENTVEILELAGYKVFSAGEGTEGFIKAKKHLPDAIICDVMMPETGGLELLQLIKSEQMTKNIPVIFFSAGSAPHLVQKGLKMGANLYLPKPFSEEQLLASVRQVLTARNK